MCKKVFYFTGRKTLNELPSYTDIRRAETHNDFEGNLQIIEP